MTTQDIKRRYFREVIAHPEGAVTHHGDCHIYRIQICTCGLLHDLMVMPSVAEDLFSDYPEQLVRHDQAIEAVFQLKG